MRKSLETCIKKITSFFNHEEGTAAIEFALIAPIMIVTFIGTVEISNAWLEKERVEAATETVADLIAQETIVTEASIAQIISITRGNLNNRQLAAIDIVVTAVRTEPNPGTGDPESLVSWSESKTGAGTYTIGDIFPETLPAGIANNYETIIYTELIYNYNSLIGRFIQGTIGFDRNYINRPRYSSDIPCDDCT